MRQIIAFVGSLSVTLILTAAGLVYDAQSLFFAGVILSVLTAVLWLYHWGTADRIQQPVASPAMEVPKVAVEAPEHSEDQRRHEAVMIEITNTARSIGYALGEGNQKGIAIEVPRLEAALLLLTKAYAMPVPDLSGTNERKLKAGAKFLGDIGAYLRLGHVEEARQKAEKLIPMLNAFMKSEKA